MNERDLFIGKINDLIRREMRGEAMVFSAFMTAEDADEASSICRKQHVPHFLYGGYEDSERRILMLSSSYDEEILRLSAPIRLLEIKAYQPNSISNRDILGALMSMGIRRECLGDIIARDGVLLFFALESISDFLIDNVKSIKNQSVTLCEAGESTSIPPPHFEKIRTTIASLRLDVVTAALCGLSREKAAVMIESGNVSLNHKEIEKKTKEISEDDRIVIRGYGKWIIDGCDQLTKKGRTVLECRKYI